MARLVQLAIVVGVLVGASGCSVDGVTFRPADQPSVEDCAVDGDEDGNGAADCEDMACAAAPACMVPASCTDGRRNGDESDVDCGGRCARCDDRAACAGNGDCASGLCGGGVCARAASCREILERNLGDVDGTYSIDLDGAESGAPFAVKCDMTTGDGGWTRFNWVTAAFPASTDPLGQLLSECGVGDVICRGRIPANVSPTHFLVKDLGDGDHAIWQFDATNTVSNVMLAAFRDKVNGCVANAAAPWQPTVYTGTEDFCGIGAGNSGCDSFVYADAAGVAGNCQGYNGWYTQMDDDTACHRAAFKVGMSAAGYSGCDVPESNFLDDGPSTDDDPFGELYYR